MVAAISPAQQEKPTTSSRPPLLPSEKDNAHNGVARKPRGRQVSSRYLSPSPSSSSSSSSTTTITPTSKSQSQRFSSPLLSRSSNSSTVQNTFPSVGPKRSQSVDRRRPVSSTSTRRPTTPAPSTKESNASQELSTATKMLITSTRSLSVSFQGEAFSLPISKTKAKATPERRRATPVRDQPWPGRTRQGNPSSNPLSSSFDCSVEDRKLVGVGSGVLAKSLNQSLIENQSRLSLDLGNAKQNKKGNLLTNESCDLVTSDDAESVSSGSTNTSGVPESGGLISKMRNGARGIAVSARFWQETNSRLRRLQDPGSPLFTSPGSRMSNPSKTLQSKRFSSDSAVNMSPRTMASPIRGATKPASPSKVWHSPGLSPSRGIPSPARIRNAVGGVSSGNSGNTPSILSFSMDLKRGKMGEDRIVDAHVLRLLYNRYLQWRFVNARADATFMVQRVNAEKNLWNAWVTISELRHSVTLKRMKLLLLRKKLKLTSILKGQMPYLEEWALLDRDHSNSLLGATEALKASTLRLPVVGKAITDIQNLKDAISSAVDVMQAMGSSLYLLSSKVENMNSLMAELMHVTAKEQFLLKQCKDYSSTLSALQIKDCSLRTHIIQLNQLSTSTTSSLTTHV